MADAAPIIAPSILAADFARLGEEARAVEAAGADWLHVDVMDGHFVPNITIGPDVVKALRPHVSIPIDVHLMIAPVDPYLEAFREAGADLMTVHPEAGPHLDRTLKRIRELGREGRRRVQPVDAARDHRVDARRRRPGAGHVGEPRLRRPVVHALAARQDRDG